MPAGLDVTRPWPVTLTSSDCVLGTASKAADTDLSAFISTVQEAVCPLHAPPHEARRWPGAGAAVRVTLALAVSVALQAVPQSMAPLAPATAPDPVTLTVRP
jgi:hypothetical protein